MSRTYFFNGYKSTGQDSREYSSFPVEAYVDFFKDRGLSLPFDVDPKKPLMIERSEVTSAKQLNPTNQNYLEKYLDPKSEWFAPRLAILPEILKRVEEMGITINDGKKFAYGEGRDLIAGELKTQAEQVFRETYKQEISKTLLKAYADILKKD